MVPPGKNTDNQESGFDDRILSLFKHNHLIDLASSDIPGILCHFSFHKKKLKIHFISKGIEKTFSVSKEEVKKDPDSLWKYIHKDDKRKILKFFNHLTQVKYIDYDEFRIMRSDKTFFWVSIQVYPTIQIDNQIIWTGIFLDINRTKLIKNSIQLHSKIIENMEEGIILVRSKDDLIVYTNSRFDELLGFTPGELIGHHISLVYSAQEKSYGKFRGIINKLRKKGKWSGEQKITKADLSAIYVAINASTIIHPEFGEVYFLVCNDITKRVLSEQQLKKTTDDLEIEREELNQKNIALKEILKQIENEKQEIREQVTENIENLILPVVNRIYNKADSEYMKIDLKTLERDLNTISSSFVGILKKKYSRLTPREIEICNMIKNGMTSKGISQVLNLSLLTVHKHRELIRKKLRIQNKDINLNTYLQSL